MGVILFTGGSNVDQGDVTWENHAPDAKTALGVGHSVPKRNFRHGLTSPA